MKTTARNFGDAHRLTHLLWEVSAHTSALTEAALADTALSAASQGVVDAVYASPGTSIAAIARLLPMTPQNISQMVARLERLGFVERRLGARGHGVALFLTAAGARAREDVDGRLQRLDRELAELLGVAHHRALVEMLDRTRELLESSRLQPDRPSDGG